MSLCLSSLRLKCLCLFLIIALVTHAYQALSKHFQALWLYNNESTPKSCRLTDKRLQQLKCKGCWDCLLCLISCNCVKGVMCLNVDMYLWWVLVLGLKYVLQTIVLVLKVFVLVLKHILKYFNPCLVRDLC